MRKLYGELFSKVYREYEYDRKQEEAIQSQIIELYKQRVRIQTHTQAQLRKILNREQFDKMIAVMDADREKMMKTWKERGGGRMGRPGGPPRGPGGGFPGPGRQGGQFPTPSKPGGI